LNYPADYIVNAWIIWRLSNYTVYPNGKSYDEQPQDLIDDLLLLNRFYAYHVASFKDTRPMIPISTGMDFLNAAE
jgi:hypothetical protein